MKGVCASVSLCLAEFHLLHTFTQAVHSCTLTQPDVSSRSDKGQTDSHRARVHTAQPAAAMADPLSPSLTDNQDSDSQSQACF